MNKIGFFLALGAASGLSVAWPAPLNLIQQGKSTYTIVLSTKASPSEKHGAQELQKFLEEMSGARLPVVTDAQPVGGNLVLVGDSKLLKATIPFGTLGPEGFALKTDGKNLIIAGGRQRGTMYGIYTFLEKLGCRWFTADVSRIPKLRTVTVAPLDETQKPAFEYREPYFTEAADKDWAARNKTNGQSARLDESTGGKVQYYPFVHSFQQLIPPEKYFKNHPEYFSLIDGKRRAEHSQLCLTNPDVLRLGVEAVERWMQEHPEATIFSVSQNDTTGWCECDNCRRVEKEEGGVHSGPLLRYVNALAAEVEKKYPGKLIDTLAYWYSEEPPSNARPRSNVRIRLCPIGACEAHPYEQCPYNAYFMKNLRAWSKITDQLYIWHYNTNFSHYLLPFPDFDELAADIPMYKRHGVAGIFFEGAGSKGGGAENAELRSYVMAKLLWNPNTAVQNAIEEFHQAYYGKAARPMLQYFELLHRQVRRPPGGRGQHIWVFENPRAPYLTAGFLTQANQLFDQAERAADNDAVRKRVRKARLPIEYTQLIWAKQFQVKNGWYAPADLDSLKERWKSFMAEVRSFGITNFNEAWTIENDEARFTRLIRPYRVTTLENARLRVRVAPELNGRIIQMIDKRSGKDLLLRPDPGSKGYPNLGGLGVFAYDDYVARMPFETKWQLDASSGPRELSMTGTCPNGLRVRRKIQLEGDAEVVHTESVLENTSANPIEAVLQSRMETDPGQLDDVVVRYRKQDGGTVEKQLIEPEKEPTGTETYSGSDRPDGEWHVVKRSGGLIPVNHFHQEQVSRCALNWSAKGENRVSLAVWSKKRTLGPGETLKLEADYGVQ
ncbi:MAG TPA: hypothetical protein DEQ47_08740 [Solibacterales bacterium]|nr:hypothetical protein [Bryobacterales bacterium]